MSTVPSNLVPTRITQLPEYTGSSTLGYFPYVIEGVSYKAQFAQVSANVTVPPTRAIYAGTGLTGGGTLAADVTLAIANGGVGFIQLADSGVTAGTYGSDTLSAVITVDQKGRVTSVSESPITLGGYVPTSRQVIAGTGLSGGGALSSNVTLSAVFSSTTPLSVGTATAGTENAAARGDHVHPAVDLSDTSETQGVLPLGRGGTGDALSPVAGAIVFSTGSKLDLTTPGSAGQVLVSNGTSSPTWGSALIVNDQPANYVYAGPTSGPSAPTSFRLLVSDDLPNSGVVSGSYGSATQVPALTINSKGVVTAASAVTITPAFSSITGKPTTLAGYGITDGVSTSGSYSDPSWITALASSKLVGTISNAQLANSSVTIGTTPISLGSTTPTLAGLTSVTVTQDPTTNFELATKQYVDTIAVTSVHYHTPVKYEVPVINLNATYSNGASGVGATLTNAGTLVAFTPDGTVASVGDRILVYNQTAAAQNGIYTVTTVGSGSVAWVLTRATDANSYDPISPNALGGGDAFFVTSGATGAGETYVCNNVGTITFGTTAITFVQVSDTAIYSAGTGLTLSGTQFSLTTPVAASSGGTGSSSYTAGDMLYASGSTAISKLGIGTNSYIMTSSGSAPQWSAPSGVSVGTATNLASGAAGSVPYQTGSGTTNFLPIGTTNYVLTAGASAPQYVAQSTLSVGSATTATTATTATNLASGAANQIPYQTGSGATSFIPAPTVASTALQWNGSSFTWSSAGSAITVTNDTSSATAYYPLFATATSGTVSSVYTSNANFLYTPSTGELKAKTVNASNGFHLNASTVSSSYTVPSGSNAFSVGPITLASGVSVTVSSGQKWVVL